MTNQHGHLTVRTDRHLIRAAGQSTRFVLVELVAPTLPRDGSRSRPPVNLAFVVDRSGSMAGRGKLDLAKLAVEEAIARLEPDDRFGVVVYDEEVDVAAENVAATEKAKAAASDALRRIEPRGSTNLSGGWLTGCEQVAARLAEAGVNRCLLLTDGLANHGITDVEQLAHHATEIRARGVSTTTFGVGADFDETLLQSIADAGGGHFYFIGSVPEIRDHITGEVGETLEIAARDVVLEVTAPDSLRIESLTPFRTEQRGSRTQIHVGDLVSGQVVRIVLRVTFPLGELAREVGALIGVTDRDEAFRRVEPALAPVALAWVYADHVANDAQARDRSVDRAVAQVFASRARQAAVSRNRAGDFLQARSAMQATADRIRGYAGSDAELNAIADALTAELPTVAAPMAAMAQKSMHFMASASMRGRTVEGRAERRT